MKALFAQRSNKIKAISADQYISKKDLSLRVSGKVIDDASVYTNIHGEEIVTLKFGDSSILYIESNRESKKLSIRYWELDLD